MRPATRMTDPSWFLATGLPWPDDQSDAEVARAAFAIAPDVAELAAEFSPADPLLTDALLYCDMTTGPGGDYVRPADRLAGIRTRYGPDRAVTRFVELATRRSWPVPGGWRRYSPLCPGKKG